MKKKILYGMMALFAVTIMSVSFTSCGDDEPDNPVPINPPQTDPVDPPQTEPEGISQKDLIGTWRYTATDSDDIDYISFNGSGRGQMIEAAEYFANTSKHDQPYPFSELIYFSYSIDGTLIHVRPDEAEYYDDFIITVNSLEGDTLDATYGMVVMTDRRMRRLDIDWEWFAKEGPASVDLTSYFVGIYEVENDRSHRLEVTKVNNYTLKIKDLKLKTELIGELFWWQVCKPEIFKIGPALYKPHSWIVWNYIFTADGKMRTEKGQYYFDGYAVKTGNQYDHL